MFAILHTAVFVQDSLLGFFLKNEFGPFNNIEEETRPFWWHPCQTAINDCEPWWGPVHRREFFCCCFIWWWFSKARRVLPRWPLQRHVPQQDDFAPCISSAKVIFWTSFQSLSCVCTIWLTPSTSENTDLERPFLVTCSGCLQFCCSMNCVGLKSGAAFWPMDDGTLVKCCDMLSLFCFSTCHCFLWLSGVMVHNAPGNCLFGSTGIRASLPSLGAELQDFCESMCCSESVCQKYVNIFKYKESKSDERHRSTIDLFFCSPCRSLLHKKYPVHEPPFPPPECYCECGEQFVAG